MYDMWHTKYNDLDGYTWCDADTCNVPSSRIEYTFVNKIFIHDLKKTHYGKFPEQ